ncbi:MAG: TGS domain-containing protein [Clostridia bacterium]|nr:TGS domain-containing protein [Clostridia bacterium]
MPANLTPQYLAAEERYRQARDKAEKIAALEEMLAVIPKHKGTDHLQADLRRRLAKLRQMEEGKAGSKSADPFHIPKEGAGQVVLLGYPNTGKSALVGALTRAKVNVADYPFATSLPVTGMMSYQDIMIQLVDLPPVIPGEMPRGMAGTLRLADLILIIVDGSSDSCLEQLAGCHELLQQRGILITAEEELRPHVKTARDLLAVMTKSDLPGAETRLEFLLELGKELSPAGGWETLAVSVNKPESLEVLRERIFANLRVIRVYTKVPGKEADMSKPFILKDGGTVLDLAELVHRDFPGKLKRARVWGSAKFPGQPVERDYRLADGDIVELLV